MARRRRSGRRASAKQIAWRRKFAELYGGGRKRRRRNEPNPRRRRARRNIWLEEKKGIRHYAIRHSDAARLGWGRRGVRSLTRGVHYNPPRRRRGRRHSLRRRSIMRYSRNPGMLSTLKGRAGAFKNLFNKDFLIEGAEIAGGAVATPILTASLLKLAKKEDWNIGVKGYVTQLVGAGVLGTVAGMFGRPRLARNLMLGGVAGVMASAIQSYVVPKLGLLPAVAVAPAVGGLGMDDASRLMAGRAVDSYLRGLGGFVGPGAQLQLADSGDYVGIGRETQTVDDFPEPVF